MNNIIDWQEYVMQMEILMNFNLDKLNHSEIIKQIKNISNIATPLMAFPLEDRIPVAGVYNL
ncbi:DUF4089 domain-containing protein [Candidatus Pantoea edessiphila]|uniref:DUF4089 domain-containing protein n=1 Tax=Candidatus Pantoea edessiphila TaxID=2044610 RepID=A0A2P5T1G7_9GAMM|nr:AtzG-like protein [Candidatus Pantoea edessiphila]PPI88418.1 DUF4089 domain-containing protein [Candidatus Pantoea edessiphila]